jgi:type IV secretory pathway VirJ component
VARVTTGVAGAVVTAGAGGRPADGWAAAARGLPRDAARTRSDPVCVSDAVPVAQARDTASVRDLPLVEVPATGSGNADRFAVVITGDGDWASFVRDVAGALAARGMPVVVLKARAYMGQARTPEGTARDVARLVETYAARWQRPHVVLVGYSRGADWLPFILARGGDGLRGRVKLGAMLGLAERSKFSFSYLDLLRTTSAPSDIPIAPELAKLKGLPLACVYGADEEESGCRGADAGVVTAFARDGGHHFDGDAAGIVGQVLGVMRP